MSLRRLTAWVVTAAVVGGCDSSGDSFRLEHVERVGSISGPADAFGQIADVAWAASDRLLIADIGTREVWSYDLRSHERTLVGRRGSGPGEYQAPQAVAASPARWAVYDAGSSRINVYSSEDGEVLNSWPVEAGVVADLEAGSDRIVLTSGLEGASRILVYSWSGELLDDTFVGTPGGEPIRPGHVCLANDELWYLDRLGEQAYRLDLTTLVRATGDTVGPLARFEADDAPFIMGFQCNDDFLVAAILNPDLSEMHYVVASRRGQSTGRIVYPRNSEGVVDGLGFLTDLRGDSILSFRTKPFSEIVVSRIDVTKP